MNIGAEKETDYGLYFAWGETQGYSGITNEKKFSWNDYKFGTESNLTKYNAADGLTTLEASDDAATVNWGGKWKMPTVEQVNELCNTENCTNEWVTNYNGSGIDGKLLTSVRNGNKLFVPAAGLCQSGSLYLIGKSMNCWSCVRSSDYKYNAQSLLFGRSDFGLSVNRRCVGYSVRPVFV